MNPAPSRHGAEFRASLLFAAACALLLFPLVSIRVDPVERTVAWRWGNLAWAAAGAFAISLAWRLRGLLGPLAAWRSVPHHSFAARPAVRRGGIALGAALALALPLASSTYQVSVLTSALISVILGLGLNIIVGLAGLLNLGYAAFYAVGAYAYALLNLHLGLGFWGALPAAGLIAAGFGLALGFPVLRLRGDYLAIVTLGFGEIVRLVLENWSELTNGPGGIANIPRPGLFGVELGLRGAAIYLYAISLGLAALAALVVSRLRDSRIGRAWMALREDETAAEAMGVGRTRTKLAALSLGAFFAGVAGVLFAARTTFVNPASFTFLESAMALAIVVLGGPGSVGGVVAAALVLVLLPEYLRPFAQYRMLVFGAALVAMMILRARRPVARP
jgi:branched-chain amino acid transport system permease protein